MMQTNATIITTTQKWIQKFVIGYTFCPFAKKPFAEGRIYYQITESTEFESCLEILLLECHRLDTFATIETTLLILPTGFDNFETYLDFLGLAETLLHQQGYDGIYQLASFHPNYCFAETEAEDATNFTNRSPYPMLHLLRENSVEKAIISYPNVEEIPERNIRITKELGFEKLYHTWKMCFKNINDK